jgi:hypothetical protein
MNNNTIFALVNSRGRVVFGSHTILGGFRYSHDGGEGSCNTLTELFAEAKKQSDANPSAKPVGDYASQYLAWLDGHFPILQGINAVRLDEKGRLVIVPNA